MVWTKIYKKHLRNISAQIEEILRNIEPALENVFLKKMCISEFPRPITLLKRDPTLTQVFSCEFSEILNNTLLKKYQRATTSLTVLPNKFSPALLFETWLNGKCSFSVTYWFCSLSAVTIQGLFKVFLVVFLLIDDCNCKYFLIQFIRDALVDGGLYVSISIFYLISPCLSSQYIN